MINCVRSIAIAVVLLAAAPTVPFGKANAAETEVQRGKYLISIIPCTDCHTPGTFLGNPDMKRYLGGSEVGFDISFGWGYVTVSLSTKKIKGLHENDFIMASKINRVHDRSGRPLDRQE
jgi:hypothetical protein